MQSIFYFRLLLNANMYPLRIHYETGFSKLLIKLSLLEITSYGFFFEYSVQNAKTALLFYHCLVLTNVKAKKILAGTSLGTLLQIYRNVYFFCEKTLLFRLFSVKILSFLSFSLHLYLVLSC